MDMTKQELEELETEVDYWIDENDRLTEKIEELEEKLAEYDEDYVNINNFIQRLKLDNLYDEKMENFIEEYFKFYNN